MKKTRKVKASNKLSALISLSACLSISFLFLAIFQVLDTNDLRYKKTANVNLIKDLKIENEKLEIQLAKLRNAQNLKESAMALDMVSVSYVSYVNVAGSSVAINK